MSIPPALAAVPVSRRGFSSGKCCPTAPIITNNYDAVARLLATHLRTSAGVLTNKHEYLYSLAGQRTNETRMDASTVAYAYDHIGQLKVADSSVNSENRGYAYDDAWNFNWRTNNGVLAAYRVNGLNELTNVQGWLRSATMKTETWYAQGRQAASPTTTRTG